MNSSLAPRVRSADLSVTDPGLKRQLLEATERVLDHGMMLLGPEVANFEAKFARACDMPLSVGVASGTSAVYLALKAMGIGPGDEIITTPMSWIATLNAIRATGATPVFVDIGADLNIDAGQIQAAITSRTRAILPVHFNGLLCDMPEILAITNRHRILLIEDASQAFGARMNGIPAGGFGDAGAFSLNPMKVLHGYGEAGAVTVRSSDIQEKIESLRYLGTINKEECLWIELNHKIDALQAALLSVSLDWYPQWIKVRQANARRYFERLNGLVECPVVPDDQRHVFFTYTINCDDRDRLKDHLLAHGVEAAVKHPILMPDQPAHADLPPTELPQARRLVGRILTLPVHEKLSVDQIDYVCDCIGAFFGR